MESNERTAFAARLALAMRRMVPSVEGPTALANALIAHFPEGVTVQTASKWLAGRSMPAQDKIDVLAKWLDVSPHWLKHGPDPYKKKEKAGKSGDGKAGPVAQQLAARIQCLTHSQRVLVEALVAEFERTLNA